MKTLTGIRPSLWARCVTAAVFQGRGEEPAPHPPEAEEYFFRGAVFEEIVVRQLQAKHGKENVERQVVIEIPGIGEGHADGYLRPEKALIEVKSTTAAHPNSDTFTFGVEQLRRYLAYHPEAERGYLYMLDPNRMRKADEYPVALTDTDREMIEDEREYIEWAAAEHHVPLMKHGDDWRPCTRPSQARGRMCPFAEACFPDWQEPPAEEITDPLALEAASELAAIKAAEATARASLKALEEGRKDAEARLSEIVPVGKSVVGPYELVRTHVQRQPTFSVKAYEAAGHSLEPLAEYFKPGAEYDTWKIATAAEAGDIDFGEEAPF